MGSSQIAIVSVPVGDQQRAKLFYTERLGFSITAEHADQMGPGKSWIMLRPSGGGAMLTLVNWFDTMPAGSMRGLVIVTDDVEKEHRRLRAAGVDVDDLKTAPWGRYATLRDSEGNGLIIQQNT
jgi:predicted enzyme related to lactoylglutathione lyase